MQLSHPCCLFFPDSALPVLLQEDSANDLINNRHVALEVGIIQWATKRLFPKLKFMSQNSRVDVATVFCQAVLHWNDVGDTKAVLEAYTARGEKYVERAINSKRGNVANELRKKFQELYKGM